MKIIIKSLLLISAVLLLSPISAFAQSSKIPGISTFIPGAAAQEKEKSKQTDNNKDTTSVEKVTNIATAFSSGSIDDYYKKTHTISNMREGMYELSKNNPWFGDKGSDEKTGGRGTIENSATSNMNAADLAKAPPVNTTRYRRISLYTMVTDNEAKPYNISLVNAFGNATYSQSEKYNNHDIGPYRIPVTQGGNLPAQIESYLNSNNVAKQLVAKWFRRSKDGTFDMKLVADRGEYDASFLEQSIAMKTVRGSAMLQDAGEELIGKTFVIVYDINFVDLGKTYKVGMTSYLYRLVWDEATASIFYNYHWIDRKSSNPAKKQAFDNSSDFKMQYVGNIAIESDAKPYPNGLKNSYVGVSYDVEYKTIPELIKKSWPKLELAFEEFRLRFPLYSADPIAAKIGSKEDIKAGDKFEVLEKIQNKDGSIQYKRIGIISVTDNNQIWDNNTMGDWLGTNKSKLEYTVFQGDKNKYAPGMLFRKIYQ